MSKNFDKLNNTIKMVEEAASVATSGSVSKKYAPVEPTSNTSSRSTSRPSTAELQSPAPSSENRAEQKKRALSNCIKASTYLAALWRTSPKMAQVMASVENSKLTVCNGLAVPVRPLFMEACHHGLNIKPPLLWITSSSDGAERLYQDAQTFFPEDTVWLFPERECLGMPNESVDAADPARLSVLQLLDNYQAEAGQPQLVIIAPLRAILQPTVRKEKLEKGKISLKLGESVDLELLIELLSSEGYRRVSMVETRGEYAVRGGLVDIYPITGPPARLELFGDEIERMRRFDVDTQRSCGDLSEVTLLPAQYNDSQEDSWFTDHLLTKAPNSLVILEEPIQLRLTAKEWEEEWLSTNLGLASFIENNLSNNYVWEHLEERLSKFRRVLVSAWSGGQANLTTDQSHQFDLNTELAVPFTRKIEDLLAILPQWHAEGRIVILLTAQFMRLGEILREHGIKNLQTTPSGPLKAGQVLLLQGYMNEGFRLPLGNGRLEFLTDRELVGQRVKIHRTRRVEKIGSALRLDEIVPGDLVVHIQHGIARYRGIETVTVSNVDHDMLKLEYANGSCIYVPVERLDMVQKYEGIDGREPALSKLNGIEWRKTKAKIRAHAAQVAEKLLQIYAQRAQAQGNAYPEDSEWQREMEDAFPYQETPDQLRAIKEVKADLESPHPMNRLICGDVGYGKTEVALRAAFKVVNNGYQVAILVPTTVLAHQHYLTFTERFAPYPINVGLLSRFRTPKEQRETVESAANGTCDILIGTHRMLSKDIEFKKLGLLIIDEEQRFGVMHKNKITQLKANIDIMSMSATPIPRTLQMSFYGLREMSVIETPPEERMPIKTYLFERNHELIKAAISRELGRQGQVYFLHNRVETIAATAIEIERMLPHVRVAVGHGKMSEHKLEEVMMDFYDGLYDILVCSTIIESGLDVPNVNTIIVDDSHKLGLAQLYQLRGRVGRSTKQGYCYLLYPPSCRLTDEARKRLETIRDFTQLGAGFQVAKRDLEIRGAGNILGAEQSGHVAAVGFSLYCRMLSDAVKALKNHQDPLADDTNERNIVIDLPISMGLPDSYISDAKQKIALYKRIASITTLDELQDMREEMRDRYGRIPAVSVHLLDGVRLKIKCLKLLVPAIRIKEDNLWVVTPFLRRLTLREKGKLAKLVGWELEQEEMALRFNGLYGRAAGHMEYPADDVLLGRIDQILSYIEDLPPEAPAEPTPPKRPVYGYGRRFH